MPYALCLFIFVEFDGFGLFWRVVTLHLAGSDSTQAVVLDEALTETSTSVSVRNSVGDTFKSFKPSDMLLV